MTYSSKTQSLKWLGLFINKYLILKDQVELRKEVQKVKETRKEGKWALSINRKVFVKERDEKSDNK